MPARRLGAEHDESLASTIDAAVEDDYRTNR